LKTSRPGSASSFFYCDCFHVLSHYVQLLQIPPLASVASKLPPGLTRSSMSNGVFLIRASS
jgi:hypothetical protein